MALFPPVNPAMLETKRVSTSVYFQREESVFFALCGKKIVPDESSKTEGHETLGKGREPVGSKSLCL